MYSADIVVHYPESEAGMLELRKRSGQAYILFIQNHIMNLKINDMEKNRLYSLVIRQMTRNSNLGYDSK
jgi:hypothetical protein